MEIARTIAVHVRPSFQEHVVPPTPPRRKATRLRGSDDRTPSLYHVVNRTHEWECLFGSVSDGTMHLHAAGAMVEEIWETIPSTFPGVSLDAAVTMPNHHHGIIFIEPQSDDELGVPLGDIVKWFRTVTPVRYVHGVKEHGWPRFDGHLWHRNDYDHIVRDDRDLERTRLYIEHNPATWENDSLHPASKKPFGIART